MGKRFEARGRFEGEIQQQGEGRGWSRSEGDGSVRPSQGTGTVEGVRFGRP